MDEPRQPSSDKEDAGHPGKMSVERWIFAVLSLMALCSWGAWRSLRGDDAGFLLLALVAVVMGIWVVAFVHHRRLPKAGPSDPSASWPLTKPADGTVYGFAYPRGAIWVARGVFGMSLLAVSLIYLTGTYRPVGADFWWMVVFAVVSNGGFLLWILAFERYRVEVGADGLVHYRLRRSLRHPFATLGSVALLQGGGRGSMYVLALYDKRGRCIDTFADTLESFTDLVTLTKEYAFAAGVAYRYRDKWGAWTR
jgi:hypothetical protein